MPKTFKDWCLLTIITLALTLLIWLPFIAKVHFYNLDFSAGLATIYRNFDGLEYAVIAKTFYDPAKLALIPTNLPANYFPAHFPGYPLLIALFAPLLGYLKSMLFVSVLFTALSVCAFYLLITKFKLTSQPLWLSIIFLILPARWVIVHSVGSPEPVAIFLTILSIYFFQMAQDKHFNLYICFSSIFACLALLVRPPGVLLFAAFDFYLLYQLISKRISLKKILAYYPVILGPLTLLAVFYFYQLQLRDFWAFFHTGDNIHLTFPPFQVFNQSQYWVGSIWLEDIIYIFLLSLLGGIMLLKSKLQVAGFFVLTFFTATIFVAHRDISRYILPVMPFVIIAFERVLVSKEFKIALIILLPAIYLYAQNFIINNTAPVPNLLPFN
ncbi:MAG: glycosyltransferase family 39 protein [Patescibacteria group bacterium]|nr:glycosyltransferase family 39 protein [Patescibacteria group bacterium]